MSVKIQFKRATKQAWLDVNPILDAGELGYETDTGHFKIGDGASRWAAVQYAAFDSDLVEARLAEEHWHKSARLATTAVLPNSPAYTAGTQDADGGYGLGAYLSPSVNARLRVDNIDALVGDRILVVNQADPIQNGLYDVDIQGSASAAWKLVRSSDMNGSASGQITIGESVSVREGDVNHYQQFAISSIGSGANGEHIIGADGITFVRYSGTESFNAGYGLTVTGNTLNVATADQSRIAVTENNIDLSIVPQDNHSASVTSSFVSAVNVDNYGRVTGVLTSPALITLGTETSGDYVENLTAGTGISLDNNGGEGSSPTISVTANTYDSYGSASAAYSDATDYADGVGTAANEYADGLASNYDPAGSASTAYTDATQYADGLASNYDPAGSASTAYTDATEYADGLASNYDPAGSASTAYTDATEYADGLASNYDPAGAAATAESNAIAHANGLTYALNDLTDVSTSSSYAIGDTGPGGGLIFITPSTSGNTTGKYFEAAPIATEVNDRMWAQSPYQTTEVSGADGTAIGTGQQNTLDIIAQGNTNGLLSAAAYCDGLTYGGQSDWFLPSNAELYQIYAQLKVNNVGGYGVGQYWSSTEESIYGGFYPATLGFADGSFGNNDKDRTSTVRPVRAFTVPSATNNVLVYNGTAWVNQDSIHLPSTTESTDDDSGALIVDGGAGIKKNLHVGGVGHFGGTPSVSLDNATAYFLGNADAAIQIGAQNSSSASYASTDYVATADNGNDTSNYLDLGVNSSTYSDEDYSSTGPNDGYLYVNGGDLVIGTATGDTAIKFNIGGTQDTDVFGEWTETSLDITTNFSVSGSAQFGDIDAGDATVQALTADTGLFEAPSASVVVTTIKGASSQSANLTEWKNSAGTTLAHVDKDGKITSPVFVGTNVGNLSFYGINNTGSTISKGAPVALTGLDSPSGNPTMTIANVADPTKMPAAGLAGADILAGETGEVVIIGQLHGIDTSSWSYNAILYVDGAGLLTTTKPTDPSHSVQPIGNVEKVATAINDGTILVNCTGTYADSPNTIAIPGSVTASAGFYGSGANITSLNANNLSAGTVPSARLSLSTSDIPTLTASKISDFATTAKGYTLDSFAVPVAAVAMNNQKITGMADPTSGSDAATKTYVDNLSSGLRIKQAVNWATNAILPNTPTYTDGAADSSQGLGDGAYLAGATNTRLAVDGNNVTTGQRVLVKNQATASHNGIYYVTEQGGGGNVWRLTRADDSNNTPAGEVRKGDYVSVLTGSANAGTSWTIANDGTATTPLNGIKIGTDAINWIQFNGAASYVAGGGMTLSGTTFDVATASSDRIVINADSIDLATVSRSDTSGSPGGSRITAITTDSYGRVTGTTSSAQADATTTTKGIASFDSGDFAVSSGAVTIKSGGVDNAQLANSSVTIGSSSVSLGGTTASLAGLTSVTATTFTGNLTGDVTGTASTVTNGVYTTDTGTVTNTMLAGSIADTKLSTISTAGKVSNSATTATASNTGSAIVARDASGNFTANIITADLSGNASTATSATTAGSSASATITDTTTTAGTYYPVFASASSGNVPMRTDSTGLTYDPSTNALTASTFSGALSGNASTATTLATARTISLGGDLSGSASFNGSADVTITATVAANSVALGTDTTGDYVASLVAGTGVTLSNNSGEGATPTVAIGQSVATTASPTFATVTATGNLNVGTSSGDGGAAMVLAKPATNTSIAGTGVIVDIYQNRMRFYEQGSNARGAYIDLTACNNTAGTNLLDDVVTSAQTASYTLTLQDKNKLVEMLVGTANNLTVPLDSSVAFPVGTQINILQTGAGQTTVVATSGVTINATPGLKIRAQWSYATLIKRATNTWVLVGDISA